MSHLSEMFRQRRSASGISLGDLARACGYLNVSRGANRIQAFERSGEIEPKLLGNLAAALGIASSEIRQAVAQDRAEWEEWASQPIVPHLVVRLIAAFYCRQAIPSDIHHSQILMEDYAADFAYDNRVRVCLVLSRKLRVWFERDGWKSGVTEDTFVVRNGPWLKVGGKEFLL